MNERELVAQAVKGELAAFNQLVERYQGPAYNVAYRLLGDADEASDATQEAFFSAFRALGGYRGGNFRAWILRIVTNACYDQLRAKRRRPTSSLEDELVPGEGSAWLDEGQDSPEEHAERQELHGAIQRGIETLPPDQRVTLVLVDIHGLSYQEVAEITHTSLGTVKSRLSRARMRLRDCLMAQEELLPRPYRLNR
jgi:RNA polymerase sigma-70 factor (ECF subfamily)